MKRDCYDVLGISRGATQDEVKAAYRREALKHHPDRNPGDREAEARFKEAAEAYEILSDPQKRGRYDKFGHDGLRGAGAGHGFTNVEDIFSAFGDIFGGGSLFEGLFGSASRGQGGARRGASLRCEVRISFNEMARGTEKTIVIRRAEACETCGGSGAAKGSHPRKCGYCGGRGEVQQTQGFFAIRTTCPGCRGEGVVIDSPCGNCDGRGRSPRQREISVRIPAGIEDGTRIRLTGEGEAGERGGPPGDLYCEVYVEGHPLFVREGVHLLCEVPITFSQAALGTTLAVPGVEQQEEVEIPRGTQSEEVFRLRGKGLPDVHGRHRGDLHVRVKVEIPKKLTKKQQELIREFAETEDAAVSKERKSFVTKLKELFGGDDE